MEEPIVAVKNRKDAGRKRQLRRRSKVRRELDKTQNELSSAKKRINKYRMEVARLRKRIRSDQPSDPDTPRKKAHHVLKGPESSVKRRLVMQQAFIDQV